MLNRFKRQQIWHVNFLRDGKERMQELHLKIFIPSLLVGGESPKGTRNGTADHQQELTQLTSGFTTDCARKYLRGGFDSKP